MNSEANNAITIDPLTGRKRFNTRAVRSSETLGGRGYDVVTKSEYKTLPEFKKDAAFDENAKEKYREFKEDRLGTDDYMAIEGKNARYLEDHYSSEPVKRDSLMDECEILCVGSGFAGLLLWYKLSKAGFTDVRFCEKGGDVGGTWYWNRYPGVACDVEAYSYLPLLDEMEHYPPTKFASGFEIYEYCQKIARKSGFYENCLFHTEVTKSTWDPESERWIVETNRGDRMRAKFVMLANGTLSTPRLARIEGMDTFKGTSFHTARWDHNVDLKGKRVGIIGTGATAVQVVPEIAKEVDHLYVFQRTPSTIDVRDQRKTTPEEIELWKSEPGWAKARRERFSKLIGRRALKANDEYLSGNAELPKRRLLGDGSPISTEERVERELQTSYRIMEQIRDRVDAIVEDPQTAEILKPYYPYGCKRPNFHDEYLPAFNRPNVTLVDTAPLGIQEINENGVAHNGEQYDLDVLIYATGFDFMSHESLGRFYDENGRSVSEKWEVGGTRTFLGMHTSGFPNLMIIAGPQGTGGSFNFLDSIVAHAEYATELMQKMRENGYSVLDVRKEDEDEYSQHCADADRATAKLRDCLSNFNQYGRAEPGSLGYYGGKQGAIRRSRALETLEAYIFS